MPTQKKTVKKPAAPKTVVELSPEAAEVNEVKAPVQSANEAEAGADTHTPKDGKRARYGDKYTPEEKAAYYAEQTAELSARVESGIKSLCASLEAGKSEDFLEYLKSAAQFYRYSYGNVLLIKAQRPNARRVAPFGIWKRNFNRLVKKGEKAIKIFAPRLVTDREAAPLANGRQPKKMVGFISVNVFDVSQTEGDPLPGEEFMYAQGGEETLLDHLMEMAQKFQVPTKWGDCAGAHGMTNGQLITLDRERCEERPAHALLVWFHEAAHVILHSKDGKIIREDDEGRPISLEQIELEAEASAYALGTLFGIDQPQKCADYLLSWQATPEALKFSLARIQKAVKAIMMQVAPEAGIEADDTETEAA